jgi:hypothetical protein
VSTDGKRLYVTHLLVKAGVTVIDTARFAVTTDLVLSDQAADASSKLIPNGQPRAVYAAVPRPQTGDLWIPHLLLATGTAQPDLDFESTVFPAVTVATADGKSEQKRLLGKPPMGAGAQGAFTDSVSGPRDLSFTPDGKLALLALSQSEDVMVLDGDSGNEVGLVRPLPSTFLEGIVVDHAGKHAYVYGRNSHNVAVLDIHPAGTSALAAVNGKPIETLEWDPMQDDFRLGQHMFYTANSSATQLQSWPGSGAQLSAPMSKNFGVACASCHIEGGTDAVTWHLLNGPRNTPSLAGGPINTGFLFLQALRNDLVQFDTTISQLQGGTLDRNSGCYDEIDCIIFSCMGSLSDFVNFAIPLPQNPVVPLDGELTDVQLRGQATFEASCQSCHSGDYLTDSGAGNPLLNENDAIVLHDVGTCVTSGDFVDKPAPEEVTGKMRMHTACDFDTPTLRGIFATAPYFHDGSAATLADVVDRHSTSLSSSKKAELVEYLKTL